jgi:glucokinase
METTSRIAAVDIGGTKIVAGLVERAGRASTVLASSRWPTDGMERAPEAVVEEVMDHWETLLHQQGWRPEELAGVGVAFPGRFEAGSGRILTAPNLPPFIGRRPRQLFERAVEARWGLSKPVAADNDTSAAVLGEGEFGAGQGVDRLIYLTISTGFGGALRVRHPPRVENLEPGLSTFPDPQRPDVPLDLLSSGVGIGLQSRRALEQILREGGAAALAEATGVLDALPGDTPEARLENLEAPDISARAAGGDPFCREQMDRAAHFAAEGIARLIEAHHPQRIVVGGGAALNAPGYLEQIRTRLAARLAVRSDATAGESPFDPTTQLVPAGLGEERGLLGAAALLG